TKEVIVKKWLSALFCFGLVVVMVAAAERAAAVLNVTIQDSAGNTLPPPPPPPPPNYGTFNHFNLSAQLTAGITTSMPLLTCGSRPCTVYFPSGRSSEQGKPDAQDTFVFRDNCNAPCASGFARVIKAEPPGSNVGVLVLDSVQISSLPNGIGKTLFFTYETTLPGDMNWISVGGTSGYFESDPVLSGSFTDTGASKTVSRTCASSSTTAPCARLFLKINGSAANNLGDSSLASVSVPCDDFDPHSPCTGWTFGYYDHRTGDFNTDDPSEIPCMSNCPQVHQALLTTAFNGTDQTLTIIQGIAILSLLADEEFGVENLGHALAQTSERDFWVGFSAALHESADALLTLSSIAADNTLPKP